MVIQISWSSDNGLWLFVHAVALLHSNARQFLRAWSAPFAVASGLGEMTECISRNPDYFVK